MSYPISSEFGDRTAFGHVAVFVNSSGWTAVHVDCIIIFMDYGDIAAY